MTRLLLETLKGNPGDRVPFWFMRQAGRYLSEYRDIRSGVENFMQLCYNPDLAMEVTLQPVRRFGMDGAILFADILVVPDGLGQKVWFETESGPRLEPVYDDKTFSGLSLSGFHDRVGNIYETLRKLKKSLPETVTLIGFAGAPWTVATYMTEGKSSRDHGAARQLGYRNPELFNGILSILVDATSEYLIRQIDHGADAVQIFDSWASAIPEPYFRRWIIEPTREIVTRVKAKHHEVPIIGFPRLSGTMLKCYVAETGVDAVSLDSGAELSWVKREIQQEVPVQGNLDPHLVVTGGVVMEEEACRILDALKGGSHIFNLGHGFLKETPVEHVAVLSELVRQYRR